jgi:hypothetical protein
MAGIPISAITERSGAVLMDQLQRHCASDVVLVKFEIIVHPGHGIREMIFWYSRISEGLKIRAARKPTDDTPKYPLKFPMPMWNTHIDLDMILAKLALVR